MDEALARALDDKRFRGSFEAERLDSIYFDIIKYVVAELDLSSVSKEIQEALQSVFPREVRRRTEFAGRNRILVSLSLSLYVYMYVCMYILQSPAIRSLFRACDNF